MTTTLLGVDDSKTMRKVIEITFAGEDFKTVLAENADDAMSKISADRPNIVLVDAALPGTSGYDLCQRIKAASPGIGVVLLASKQQPYDRGRGSQVGADDFVDKPFDTQQLIDKVSALARKLAGGTQSHPMATTQHGIGPGAAPAAASAPAAPHAAHAPQAVVSARPVSLEVGTRPRSPTLAYGNVNPMAPAGPGPVAPMIPSPAAPVPPRSNPLASPAPPPARPIAAASPPAAPAPAPYSPPAAHAAPTPPPPAPAGPIAAAAAAVTNGADFATKLGALGLTRDQVTAVLALSREVVEKVVWEVVPTLAETLIKEEIKRLTAE